MNIQDLLQAINECNNGQLVFNLGNSRSFLHNKKWYPLRLDDTNRTIVERANLLTITK